jgi:hypothetical protein
MVILRNEVVRVRGSRSHPMVAFDSNGVEPSTSVAKNQTSCQFRHIHTFREY